MADFEYVDVNGRQIRVRPRETAQEIDEYGNFHRQPNRFTEAFGEGKNPVEKDRYILFWAKGCNWSNRAAIARELLGLEDAVKVEIVDWTDREENLGWEFVNSPDHINPETGAQFLSELYYNADEEYTGRTTVAREQLKNVGLLDHANHYPRHMSGGQQQRVAIARALAMEPKLLLLDEPTSALDPELVGEVLDTIKKAANEGYTMLLVSHEMSFVRNVATRVIFLDGGKILEDGTPREVFGNPKNERVKEFFTKINRMEEPDYSI